MKVAFVVQRYGNEVSGGAEQHCRLVAEHLSQHMDVEILTTCADDYTNWKNHFPKGNTFVNNLLVRRFPVTKERDPVRFGRIQNHVFYNQHTEKDELLWMEEQGPCVPALIKHIARKKSDYDFFIFFSYRYYHSYYGLQAAHGKAVLVPTAEEDDAVKLSIFKKAFQLPSAIVYNSFEERNMIQSIAGNHAVLNDVVGTGSSIPETVSPQKFRKKYGIGEDFLLYVGRIDQNKGFPELFRYYLQYLEETGDPVRLVLIGTSVVEIPFHSAVIHLGFLPEEDKYNAIAASNLLLMPSYYESLSMVVLEAWALGKPVLVNGRCRVLRGQALRSNGGLYYTCYEEFREALKLLAENQRLRGVLGENGKSYFQKNYAWPVIEEKYSNLLHQLQSKKTQ